MLVNGGQTAAATVRRKVRTVPHCVDIRSIGISPLRPAQGMPKRLLQCSELGVLLMQAGEGFGFGGAQVVVGARAGGDEF